MPTGSSGGGALLETPGFFSLILPDPSNGQGEAPSYSVLTETGRILFKPKRVIFETAHAGGGFVELDLGSAARLEPIKQGSARANFFLAGGGPRSVRLLERLCYREVAPGIDLCYQAGKQGLKSEFLVEPEADPSQIRLSYRHHKELDIRRDGALVISTSEGEIIESPPRLFQVRGGRKETVAGSFRLLDENAVGFEVGPYDRDLALMIDPSILIYSTFLGGEFLDNGRAIAVDDDGSAYVLGFTNSLNFPLLGGNQPQTQPDFFLARFDRNGTSLDFITFVGGSQTDIPSGLGLDASKNIYIAGYTNSLDFPTTAGAFSRVCSFCFSGTDAFVMKLDPSGSRLVYSTFFGGPLSEEVLDLAVDGQGNAYVTGSTQSAQSFPLVNPFQSTLRGARDAFLFKLDPSGSRLIFSTYFGGNSQSNRETGLSVAVDSAGRSFISGRTDGTGLPTLNAFQASPGGFEDAFVAGFGATGTLLFSTYLGGSGREEFCHVGVDGLGNVVATGDTVSTNFPVRNPLQAKLAEEQPDMFITKFSGTGAVAFSTYFGGPGPDGGRAVSFDRDQNIIVAGDTRSSSGLPLSNEVQRLYGGGNNDALVVKISPDGSRLMLSTFLGGFGDDFANDVAVDQEGAILVTGFTTSADFPLQNAAQRALISMAPEAFLAKIEVDPRRILWFPQVGNGRSGSIGFQTALSLVNTLDKTSANIEFFDSLGRPLSIGLAGRGTAARHEIPLDGGETVSLATTGSGALQVGYARVDAGIAVGGTLVFIRSDAGSGRVLYEAGLPAADVLREFSVLVDRRGDQNTGLAMVNVEPLPAAIQLGLYNSDFEQVASASLQLPAGHHLARFVHEFFSTAIPKDFEGSLTVESDRLVAAFTLRQFDRADGTFLQNPPTLTVFPVIKGRADRPATAPQLREQR